MANMPAVHLCSGGQCRRVRELWTERDPAVRQYMELFRQLGRRRASPMGQFSAWGEHHDALPNPRSFICSRFSSDEEASGKDWRRWNRPMEIDPRINAGAAP